MIGTLEQQTLYPERPYICGTYERAALYRICITMFNIRFFQSLNRETDLMLARTPYLHTIGFYAKRDFTRPIGDINFHFMSRHPQPIQNYLTITNPFDIYVWSLLAASVVSITVAFLIVDISHARWSKTPAIGVFHQSMPNIQSFAKKDPVNMIFVSVLSAFLPIMERAGTILPNSVPLLVMVIIICYLKLQALPLQSEQLWMSQLWISTSARDIVPMQGKFWLWNGY